MAWPVLDPRRGDGRRPCVWVDCLAIMGGWVCVRNNGVALRCAAFLLAVALLLVVAISDAWSSSTLAERLTMAACVAPGLVAAVRATVMGAWVHEPSRRLWVITWFRRYRYDFDDISDVRIDTKRGVAFPAVVRADGSKVEIPMLQRSAFLGDILVSRPEDYQPHIRRLRALIGHWGVRTANR